MVGVTAPPIAAKLRSHADFWERRPGSGPLVTRRSYAELDRVDLVLRDGSIAPEGLLLHPEMLDAALLAQSKRLASSSMAPIAHAGDSLPVALPLYQIPWMEAILGCPIEVGRESLWSQPRLEYPWDLETVRLREGNAWLAKLLELTQAYVAAWGPEVLVTQTLLRGPIDMLTALLGAERTVYALRDHPEECRALLAVCTEAFIEVATAQQGQIPRLQGGHSSFFGIWAPGSVVRTQCDFSALTGPHWYESRILPFDVEICEAFDYSVIHLHSGYLFTVDALLTVEKPQAIQVSLDVDGGVQPLASLVPVFRRILERKPLMITGPLTPRELDVMLQELPGEGLFIDAFLVEESAQLPRSPD